MNIGERKNHYAGLCDQGKINGIFMQPWWLDATGEWDVSLAYRNNQLVGALPFRTGRKWGLSYIGMPQMTHHLNIYMEKPRDISEHKWLTREKQIIWSLIDNLPPFGFFSMVFEEDSFDNWLPFHWKDFRQEMRYTFIIDRKDPGVLDQHINRNLKRNIREASDTVEIKTMNDSKVFFALCVNTYKRQKMKMPYDYSLFKKIDEAILQNNSGIKLGAYTSDNKISAVAYLLWDQNKAYYFLAGDDNSGRSSGASILLGREALQIAFEEKKVDSFDFCGSMLEPVSEMRRQFGARTVPLMKIFKANYKWLDILYQLTH